MLEQSNSLPPPDEVFLSTPEVRGGVACFAGTRVGVSQLLGHLRTATPLTTSSPTSRPSRSTKRSSRLSGSTTSTSGPSSGHAYASTIPHEARTQTPPVRVLVDECLPQRVGDVLGKARPEHEFEHVGTVRPRPDRLSVDARQACYRCAIGTVEMSDVENLAP